jgi:branched-chain amino acid transport system permease protein
VSATLDWLRGVPAKPVRLLGPVLLGLYLYRVAATAPSAGQLFNFTMIGLAAGCVYAIAASGLVLTYATTGVFNFAHGAVGMLAAYLYWSLSVQHGLPAALAAAIVLLGFGPLVGLVIERVMRNFRDASVQTTIVVTIALFVMLIGLAQRFWPPSTGAFLPRLFGDHSVNLWQAKLTYDNVAAIVLAVVVAFLLRELLFRSRTGVAMRAVVDNPGLAALTGASPVTVARLSWMLGSMLAALAGILLASGGPLDPIVLTLFVAGSYGAAVVGKLKNLPLTFVGALALGIIANHAFFALPRGSVWSSVRISIPGIFLFLALLLVPAAKLSAGRVVGVVAPRVPGLASSVARSVVFVGAMALLVELAPASRLTDLTTGMIYALLLLSLVVLTGFSGQISLCQYVFLAIGAWAMGSAFGGNSIWGMLLAGVVALPLGIIVALPAMRLKGLYFALVTFALASVGGDLLLKNPHLYGSKAVVVGRLHLFGMRFDGDRAFFLLCTVVFVVFAIGVLALRRGAFGRRLAALRDSEAACATLGLDVRRTKLAVFMVSAFIAGVAGALFGGLKTTADAIQFDPINNIVLLLFAVVGGITTVTGALLGGALFALLPFVQSQYPNQAGLVFAGVAVAVVALGRQPNGLAGLLYGRFRAPARAGADVAGEPAAAQAGAAATASNPETGGSAGAGAHTAEVPTVEVAGAGR